MAMQDDFAAAKLTSLVAVYCGSVPKFKSRYTALRGGSIDSNLQFCGRRWTTEEALTQDPQEREVSSAALKTIQISDKLKTRMMSEDLLASQRGLTDGSDPERVTLKPVVSRPASQRLLETSKPVPPIQNRLPSSEPRTMGNREQEHGEHGTGCGDSDGNNKEPTMFSYFQASLLPLYCSDEDGKKSLGVALIPPIPRSARPSDGDAGSTAVPLPSSQHLVIQGGLKMRPRSGSRSEERTLKHQELQTLEPILPVLQRRNVGGVKSAGHLCEPLPPLTGLPLSQAKETDHLMSPRLPSDDDLKDSNGKIQVTLSKSAQKKILQKRIELLRREREKEMEKSLQRYFLVSAGFGPLPVNGPVSTSPSMSNARREHDGAVLKKRINRSSLPSIRVVSQGSSSPRNSSVDLLPAIPLDFLEQGEELEFGDAQEARPFPYPQQALLNALKWLSSDD
ncbi:TOG array regulator of axonemal microtubules protein 2, partial [Antrostomus carolinensis]|uniref:TOG array regulator of axonemal microtubules protein 2 n=1 Tax=Antrostomus carolinensis TaxID=279965 RepID=UPI0005294BBD